MTSMYIVDWIDPPEFSAVIVYPAASCNTSGDPEITPDGLSERPTVRLGEICQDVIDLPVALGVIEMGCPIENVKEDEP